MNNNLRKHTLLALLTTFFLLSLILFLGYVPAPPGWVRILGPLPGYVKLSWFNVFGYVMTLSLLPLVMTLAFRVFPVLRRIHGPLITAFCLVLSVVLIPPLGGGGGFLLYPPALLLFIVILALIFRRQRHFIQVFSFLKSPLSLIAIALLITSMRIFILEHVVLSEYLGMMGVILIPLSIPVLSALWLGVARPGETVFRSFLPAIGAWLLGRVFTPLYLYTGDVTGSFGLDVVITMNTILLQIGIMLLFSYFEDYFELKVEKPIDVWKLALPYFLLSPVIIALLYL